MDPETKLAVNDDWSGLLSEPPTEPDEPRRSGERLVPRPRSRPRDAESEDDDREIQDCIDSMKLDLNDHARHDTARMPAADPSSLHAIGRRAPERPTTRMEVTPLLAKARRSEPPTRDHVITRPMSVSGSGIYEVVAQSSERPAERRRATQLLPTVGSDETDAIVAPAVAVRPPRADATQPFGRAPTTSAPVIEHVLRAPRSDEAQPYERSLPARTSTRNAVRLSTVAPAVSTETTRAAAPAPVAAESARPLAWLLAYGVVTTMALLTALAFLALR